MTIRREDVEGHLEALNEYGRRVNRRNMIAIPFNLGGGIAFGLGLVILGSAEQWFPFGFMIGAATLVFIGVTIRTGGPPPPLPLRLPGDMDGTD